MRIQALATILSLLAPTVAFAAAEFVNYPGVLAISESVAQVGDAVDSDTQWAVGTYNGFGSSAAYLTDTAGGVTATAMSSIDIDLTDTQLAMGVQAFATASDAGLHTTATADITFPFFLNDPTPFTLAGSAIAGGQGEGAGGGFTLELWDENGLIFDFAAPNAADDFSTSGVLPFGLSFLVVRATADTEGALLQSLTQGEVTLTIPAPGAVMAPLAAAPLLMRRRRPARGSVR